MSESTNNLSYDKSGISETITSALRQPSFLRVMLLLATLVIVFLGMRLAAPILDPILFAVILALLFSPIYAPAPEVTPPDNAAPDAPVPGGRVQLHFVGATQT